MTPQTKEIRDRMVALQPQEWRLIFFIAGVGQSVQEGARVIGVYVYGSDLQTDQWANKLHADGIVTRSSQGTCWSLSDVGQQIMTEAWAMLRRCVYWAPEIRCAQLAPLFGVGSTDHPVVKAIEYLGILDAQAERPNSMEWTSAARSKSDTDLVRWVVQHAGDHPYGETTEPPKPRWSHVMAVFGLGSTSAKDLCRRHGVDPDEVVS